MMVYNLEISTIMMIRRFLDRLHTSNPTWHVGHWCQEPAPERLAVQLPGGSASDEWHVTIGRLFSYSRYSLEMPGVWLAFCIAGRKMVNAWWKSVHLQAGFVQWDSTLQPNVYYAPLHLVCWPNVMVWGIFECVIFVDSTFWKPNGVQSR